MKRNLCRVVVTTAFLLGSIPATVTRGLWIGPSVQASSTSETQIRALRVTLLSTMLVAEPTGFGEWGFSALVEADGHRILVDTGAHPETVLQNAHDLKVDLSNVQEVILTHNHDDHVTGLLNLASRDDEKEPRRLVRGARRQRDLLQPAIGPGREQPDDSDSESVRSHRRAIYRALRGR
jgi:7,8-dihydropterin-6-yl-methyl-4-(beta-D-ribofuranosyl)aminobenzene 5'-phosphate synthase